MRTLHFFKFFISTCLFASSCSVSATLIERDYLEWGDGGITFDEDSDYEWLDLSHTRAMSFNEYNEFIERSGEGWMFANSELVSNLLAQYTLTSEVNDAYGKVTHVYNYGYHYYNKPLEQAFIDIVDDLIILGETMSTGSQNDTVKFYGIRGYVENDQQTATHQYAAYYNEKKTTGVVSLGSFVGQPVGSRFESYFTYREARPEVIFDPDSQMLRTSSASFAPVQVSEPPALGLFALILSMLFLRRHQG